MNRHADRIFEGYISRNDDAQSEIGPWTTKGPVRGGCGHKHRSIAAAASCIAADRAWCVRRGGFSDREIRQVDPT